MNRIARHRAARWEPRAAMSMARLWCSQGKRKRPAISSLRWPRNWRSVKRSLCIDLSFAPPILVREAAKVASQEQSPFRIVGVLSASLPKLSARRHEICSEVFVRSLYLSQSGSVAVLNDCTAILTSDMSGVLSLAHTAAVSASSNFIDFLEWANPFRKIRIRSRSFRKIGPIADMA